MNLTPFSSPLFVSLLVLQILHHAEASSVAEQRRSGTVTNMLAASSGNLRRRLVVPAGKTQYEEDKVDLDTPPTGTRLRKSTRYHPASGSDDAIDEFDESFVNSDVIEAFEVADEEVMEDFDGGFELEAEGPFNNEYDESLELAIEIQEVEDELEDLRRRRREVTKGFQQ